MSDTNKCAVRRAVAEADGWKLVTLPDPDGFWYAVDRNGKHHLISEAINATSADEAWNALCKAHTLVFILPYYESDLNDIWPLFKRHGLARTGLVMSSFLQSEPKDAAFRLCEIFLELIEEQKEETLAELADSAPAEGGGL